MRVFRGVLGLCGLSRGGLGGEWVFGGELMELLEETARESHGCVAGVGASVP